MGPCKNGNAFHAFQESARLPLLPDPDLLPLELEQAGGFHQKNVAGIAGPKKHRFMKDFGLPLYSATVLIAEKPRAEYFESALLTATDTVANWFEQSFWAF